MVDLEAGVTSDSGFPFSRLIIYYQHDLTDDTDRYIHTVYDLYYDHWVEASAGGLLVPESLYSPVAMYYVTSMKYVCI